MYKKPKLELQSTTLWDYPSQHYGEGMQGDRKYKGATPSYVVWNLLKRYTRSGDTVLDPMCGSGTTLDVCADTGRRGLGFDLQPYRDDIGLADARHLPLKAESVDFVFVDPPYSTHLKYSGLPECIGELDADGGGYYEAMAEVIAEIDRVLRPGRYMALYVSDSWRQDHPFAPIGFELFQILRRHFEPVDIVAVVRHNRTMNKGHWHRSATAGNFYLRGFNYLFIMKKPGGGADQREPVEVAEPDTPPADKPRRQPKPTKTFARGKHPKKKKHRI
jgi:adenine-specific DNA-methyltransferase